MIRRSFVCLIAGALSVLALLAVTADDAAAQRLGPTCSPNVFKVKPPTGLKVFQAPKLHKLGPGKLVPQHKIKGPLNAGPRNLLVTDKLAIPRHKMLLPQKTAVNTLFWRGQ